MQKPVREIERYRTNPVAYKEATLGERTVLGGVRGVKTELLVKIAVGSAEKTGIKLFESENNHVTLYYSAKEGKVVFDRSKAGVKIDCDKKEKDAYIRSVRVKDKKGIISFRIFLDVSSCEVFINDGEKVMTSNVYTKEKGEGISFFAEGGEAKIVSLTKYDIEVGCNE